MISRSILVVILVLAGCASGSRSTIVRFDPGSRNSRDHYLQYRVPAGWLDVTSDSLSSPATIWLIRNDYAATLLVKEISIDAESRTGIDDGELLQRLARLSMALESGSARTVREPEAVSFGDRMGYVYEVSPAASSDTVRVVVLRAGARIYEVRALATGGHGISTGEVFAVQEGFVRNLQW